MQCTAYIIMLLMPVDAEMHRVANSRDFNAVFDVAVDEARKEIKTAQETATWQQLAPAVTPPNTARIRRN